MIAFLRYLLLLGLAGNIYSLNVSALTMISEPVKHYNALLEKAARMQELARPDSAIYYYNQISSLPLSSDKLAINYLKIGDIHRSLSKFHETERQINKFDSLYVASLLDDSLLIAQRNYLKGKLLSNKGQFEIAAPYFESSIRLKSKFLGENAPELAKVHNFKGINYYFQGNYDLAMREYNEALDICTFNSLYNIDLADILQNKAIIYSIWGEFDSAFHLIDKSRIVRETIFPPDSKQLGTFYLNYGHFANIVGELQNSLNYYYKAEKIFSDQLNTDQVVLGYLFINIGSILQIKGDLEMARIYLTQAISKLDPLLGPTHPTTISAYINLGSIYLTLGDYAKAKSLFLSQKGLPADIVFNQKLIRNLARTYYLSGDSDNAILYFNQAIDFSKRNFGLFHQETANSLNSFGEFYMHMNQPELALDLFEEAAYIMSLALGSFDQEMGYIYINLAKCNAELNNYKVADSLFQLAETVFRDDIEILINERFTDMMIADTRIINYFAAKAELYQAWYAENQEKDKLLKSLLLREQGLNLVDKLGLGITDESRMLLNENVRKMLSDALDVCYTLYKNTQDPAFIDMAFKFAGRSKATVLLSSIRKLHALKAGGVPDEVTNAERDINEQISAIRKLIFDENQLRNPNYDRISFLESRHFNLVRKHDSLLNYIERNFADYYALRYDNKVFDLKSIRSMLAEDEVLMEYIIDSEKVFVFVISRNDLVFHRSDDADIVGEYVGRIIEQTKTDFSRHGRDELNDFIHASTGLYSVLIKPFADIIINKRLIIIPDGILSYLPFEILLDALPQDNDRLDYNTLPYLMVNNPISYAYSSTIRFNGKSSHRVGGNRVLAFVPDYTDTSIVSATRASQNEYINLGPLPFALQEANNVKHSMGGKVLQAGAATKENFLRHAPSYDILHLAMHAQINEINPLYSRLFFQAVSDTIDQFTLSTYELYGLKLDARMVVLSACNTGAGQLAKGEGIMSLTRGFVYAGVPSIVMSNWEVNDETGSIIIEKFYHNLRNGDSKDVALQKAKLSYLGEANQLKSHPYFWSAYVLVGDSSPLVNTSNRGFLFYLAIIILLLILIFTIRHKKKRKY